MKKIPFLLLFIAPFLLASCAHDDPFTAKGTATAQKSPTLVDRVQNAVVTEQQKLLASMPSVIADMEDKNGVADYEKNRKGAGFSRTYESDDKMLTVFVANNAEFGIEDGATPAAATAMERLVKEFDDYRSTGLYRNVKIESISEREMGVSGVKYVFLRTTASFERKGEKKTTYIALIPSKKLMSYIRIRLTYPSSFAAAKLQNAALKAVMTAVSDFE